MTFNRRILLALLLSAGAIPLLGDQHPNAARGFQADRVYQFGEVDHVNLYNGNLSLTIPIGGEYSGNGSLKYRFTLVYNSKAWDSEVYNYENLGDYSYCHPLPQFPVPPECFQNYLFTKPSKSSNAGMGWQLSLGRLLSPSDPSVYGGLAGQAFWMYEGTDGAQHSFLGSGSGSGGYTVDGSFLRMAAAASGGGYDVFFPDGTVQNFEQIPGSTSNSYRLKDIRDPFGNHLAVTYAGNGDWTLNEFDAGTNVVRQHYVHFQAMSPSSNVGQNYQSQVSSIDLAAFGPARAVYTLQYTTDGIHYGCHGDFRQGETPNPTDSNAFTVPRLRHILLPDGSQWSADYYAGGEAGDPNQCSAVSRLTFPASATIDWSYSSYTLPTTSCRHPATPYVYQEDAFFESVDGVSSKKLTVNGQAYNWSYTSGIDLPATFACSDGSTMPKAQEAITTVVGPDKKTVHYFSIWSDSATYWNGGAPISATYFDRSEYGLPYTRSGDCAARPTDQEFCLSWQEFECPGGQCNTNPSRLHYVRYQGESESSIGRQSTTGFYGYGYRREVAERTKFCEKATGTNPETDCHTEHHVDAVRSHYDGLGHFRQTDTASSQPWVSGSRTEFTNFNPSLADVTVDAVTWWNTPKNWPGSAPTLLSLFDTTFLTTASGPSTTTVKSKFCFDSNTGFLKRKRTLTDPGAEGSTDLLAVFDKDANGNVNNETYFGGDKNTLSANFATCTGSTSGLVAGYSVNHAYSSGVLASTEYPNLLKTLDLTIDANSGLPSGSKDPAGLLTTYQYDPQARLTTETPPGQAWTEYVYSPTANPPAVAIRQRANGAPATNPPITERRFYFDGLGRPIESRTRMPDAAGGTAQWSVTQTTYDAFGRTTATSMPEYRSDGAYGATFNASHWQTSQYDPFGRVIKVTTPAPDSKDTTIGYTGVKSLTRTQTINASTASTTTETYDPLGRLVTVDEPSFDGVHSNTSTRYAYEAGGHLTEVDMDDHTPADLQIRKFVYDGRGFLTLETHPELGRSGNGTITYGSYDARGHVGKKLVGALEPPKTASDFDLAYSYDGAERLIAVDQILNRSSQTTQPLKRFNYATDDGAFSPPNHRTGRLDSAVRYNYPSSLPNQVITPPSGTFIVTENFFYQNDAGLLSSHAVKIEHDTQSPTLMQQTTQRYTYNDLGQVTQLTYPDCPSGTCGSGSPITASVPLAGTYSYGRLRSITGYGSLTYLPNGLVSTLIHGQNGGANVVDTTAPDDSGMPRPQSITFTGWDDCVRPTPTISAAGEVCPSSTGNTASVAVSGTTYQWSITNGQITDGATSSSIHYTAGASGTVVLSVSVSNSCGTGTDTKNVLAGPTAQIISLNQTINAGSSATIQVQLTGTPNWSVTLAPGNITQSNIASSPASFTLSPTTTTTYSVSAVSDAFCAGTVTGGSVTITVLWPPSGFMTWKASNNSKIVSMQWNLVSSATSYRIERTAQVGSWGVIAPNCQQVGSVMQCTDDLSATSFSSATSFVYRVEAVANGVTSDPSAMDYATVANQLFSDEPLVGGSTLIGGRHVSELRAAVDAVRLAANKPRKWWPNYPAQTGIIKAVHFYDPNYANNLPNATDLRNVLDEAVLAIRGVRISYSLPAPATGGRILAYQVEEIRTGVK